MNSEIVTPLFISASLFLLACNNLYKYFGDLLNFNNISNYLLTDIILELTIFLVTGLVIIYGLKILYRPNNKSSFYELMDSLSSSYPDILNSERLEIINFKSENIPKELCDPITWEIMTRCYSSKKTPQQVLEQSSLRKFLNSRVEDSLDLINPTNRELLGKEFNNNLVRRLDIEFQCEEFTSRQEIEHEESSACPIFSALKT